MSNLETILNWVQDGDGRSFKVKNYQSGTTSLCAMVVDPESESLLASSMSIVTKKTKDIFKQDAIPMAVDKMFLTGKIWVKRSEER